MTSFSCECASALRMYISICKQLYMHTDCFVLLYFDRKLVLTVTEVITSVPVYLLSVADIAHELFRIKYIHEHTAPTLPSICVHMYNNTNMLACIQYH